MNPGRYADILRTLRKRLRSAAKKVRGGGVRTRVPGSLGWHAEGTQQRPKGSPRAASATLRTYGGGYGGLRHSAQPGGTRTQTRALCLRIRAPLSLTTKPSSAPRSRARRRCGRSFVGNWDSCSALVRAPRSRRIKIDTSVAKVNLRPAQREDRLLSLRPYKGPSKMNSGRYSRTRGSRRDALQQGRRLGLRVSQRSRGSGRSGRWTSHRHG